MAWDIRNLIRPVAPGISGAVNPLAFIGAGMASGDPGGQLARMGQLQTVGQQNLLNQRLFMMQQQEAARKAKQAQALTAIAPGVAKEMFPTQPNMQAMLAMHPALLQEAMKQKIGAEQWQTVAPEEAATLGFKPGSVVQRSASTGQLRVPGSGGVSITNIPAPTAGYEYFEGPEGDLQARKIAGGPAEKPTEKQMDVAAYVQNAEVADDMLSKLKGWTPSGAIGAGNMATRLLVGQADKKARDLQLAWTLAVLRAESGAAIHPSEAEQQIQVFFEMPGDSDELKEQKRKLRGAKLESMRQRAGRAYKPLETAVEMSTATAAPSPAETDALMDKYLPR